MEKRDVKIGMEIVMTQDYCTYILKGEKYKILRKQGDETGSCFVVDHDGKDSYLAPYSAYFEPTDPDFIPSKISIKAEEILKQCTGNSYGITNAMHLKAMKLYANAKLDEAASIFDNESILSLKDII